MLQSKGSLDSSSSIQNFISRMTGIRQTPKVNLSGNASQGKGEQEENEDRSSSQRNGKQEENEDRFSSQSPSPQARRGLQAPNNTPAAKASSPPAPSDSDETDIDHNMEVSGAISEFVQNMTGRSLKESMWAPGGSGHRSTTPMNIPVPERKNLENFERPSSKVADSDSKTGINIFGDRVSGSAAARRRSVTPSKASPSGDAKYVPPHLRSGVVKHPPTGLGANEDTASRPVNNDNSAAPASHFHKNANSGSLDDQPHVLNLNNQAELHAMQQPNHTNGTVSTHSTTNEMHFQKMIKVLSGNEHGPPNNNQVSESINGNSTDRNEVQEKLRDITLELHELNAGYESQHLLLTKDIANLQEILLAKQQLLQDIDTSAEQKRAHLEEAIAQLGKDLARVIEEEPKLLVSQDSPLEDRDSASTNKSNPKSKNLIEDHEDREHKAVFESWPSVAGRDKAPAQVRKVVLTRLPPNFTYSFVAALIFGGPIEQIHVTSETSANVKFLDSTHCKKYCDATENGLVYGKDSQGRELYVFVKPAQDVDVIGGLLQGWIAVGVTRCVRAVGVDQDLSIPALKMLANSKRRTLEGISEGKTPGGARYVIFRFAKIDDAHNFKGQLSRDEDWEQCNITFTQDPCEKATGVHFED